MAYGTFGDLRSVLSGAPGKATWDALCAEVRRWPLERFESEVMPYALRHLERWPDKERVCRTFWVMDMLRRRPRGAHVTCLARHVTLTGESLTMPEWRRFVEELDWRSLRTLSLHQAVLPSGWLEVLAGAPWFYGLSSLDLRKGPWVEELKEGMLEGWFGHLNRLDLGDVGVDAELLYGLCEGTQWLALEYLSLQGHQLGEAGYWEMVESETFPRVPHLDLRFTLHRNTPRWREEEVLPLWFGVDVLEGIQAAPWFDAVKRLELFWVKDYLPSTPGDWSWGERGRVFRAHTSYEQHARISAFFMEQRSSPLADALGWR